jgi:hypothetical protein
LWSTGAEVLNSNVNPELFKASGDRIESARGLVSFNKTKIQQAIAKKAMIS